MADGRLILGTRRYSSWSLRGWLAVRLAKLNVDEIVVPLAGGGQPTPELQSLSPSGLAPYLEHNGNHVWETLAICEYCHELSGNIWPADFAARTHARVIATEMHGGFRELRMAMPMNLGRDFTGRGRTPRALADIARIEALWAETRARFGAGGPFLFGAAFNGADAMYAPIVTRLLTYAPAISPATRAYCGAVRAHPLMAEWYDAAAAEPEAWVRAGYEDPA